ncbi:protein phosphatase [Alkalicoccobacillus plakortidis]|uniref:Protein phosphatase n=1 Tax=Alkalicoccobacillus plakortidis TaxID=444060 RepID=A0A9D5DQI7_9BACI|nr:MULTISPECIES: Stp1/IreP family PP2C-type Ser/Thr phosphatase [Bacillaceae]KQL58191.1 protein phosphatase [Alkalicoccobacillus plakortidis]
MDLVESTAFLTDIGKVRSNNEDNGAVLTSSSGTLAFVADGMGGHSAGDVASAIALRIMKNNWDELPVSLSAVEAEAFLQETFVEMNQAIYTHAKENKDCEGMGTTAVAAFCTEDYIAIAHVGDSRLYLVTEEGLKQQTMDHSLVAELVKNGQLSHEEAEDHPRKNIVLRALGTESVVKVDTETIAADAIRLLMICSDGLSDKVKDTELATELNREDELSQIAKSLVARANDRGGEDNISVALVRFTEELE